MYPSALTFKKPYDEKKLEKKEIKRTNGHLRR